jgi:subtilisin family serine protease
MPPRYRPQPRLIGWIVLLTLLMVPRPAAAGGPSARPDEVVIGLRPGITLSRQARPSVASAGLSEALRRIGAVAALPVGGDAYRVRLTGRVAPDQASSALLASDAVAYAEPNRWRTRQRLPNDPMLAEQWALTAISAPAGWEQATSATVPIAIIDSGISPTHLDLKQQLLPGIDLVSLDDDPRDDDGHGTYTAGLAAASGDDGVGIAGVCWSCPIIPIKALDRRGRGDDATIALGIRWAVDRGARIISMALGGPNESRVLDEAVRYATSRGALIVAAAGNDGVGGAASYPAAFADVLSVAALDRDGSVAAFSTAGPAVDLAAPGVQILSTSWQRLQGDGYEVADGTSAASPQVAGVAALVLGRRDTLTPDQLADVLRLGADDVDAPGPDDRSGYGRVDLQRSLALVDDPNLLQSSVIEGQIRDATWPVTLLLDGATPVPLDADGRFRLSGLAPGTYVLVATDQAGRTLELRASVNGTALGRAWLDGRFLPDERANFVAETPDGLSRWFPETGHTLRGAFQAFWERHGGLATFGYPISREFVERDPLTGDRLVQYFERHRLELHPEAAPGSQVQLTRLGDRLLRAAGIDWYGAGPNPPIVGCRFFEATGRNLCGAFLAHWRAGGIEGDGRPGFSDAESLALFGYPLGEAQPLTLADGRTIMVQWFERARFEDHGEQGVLLGLLGDELARARGLR